PAAPRVRRHSVHVARRNVRFCLVLVKSRARRSVVDRIQERKQFASAVAIAKMSVSDQGPERSVRVLSSVLAHARNISFDVAGIERALIKWRREKNHESVASPDKIFFDSRHCTRGAMPLSRAGDNAPGLHNRINAALFILSR